MCRFSSFPQASLVLIAIPTSTRLSCSVISCPEWTLTTLGTGRYWQAKQVPASKNGRRQITRLPQVMRSAVQTIKKFKKIKKIQAGWIKYLLQVEP